MRPAGKQRDDANSDTLHCSTGSTPYDRPSASRLGTAQHVNSCKSLEHTSASIRILLLCPTTGTTIPYSNLGLSWLRSHPGSLLSHGAVLLRPFPVNTAHPFPQCRTAVGGRIVAICTAFSIMNNNCWLVLAGCSATLDQLGHLPRSSSNTFRPAIIKNLVACASYSYKRIALPFLPRPSSQ